MDRILKDMLGVMETHIDFERLLEELGSEATNLPDISQGWSDGLRRAIDHQAMSLSQSPETFGTWLLINKLKETNDDKVIDGVISVGVVLRDLMYINHQNLIELLIKYISFISLYSIFKLHTAGLVLIHEILSNSSFMKETVCKYFITSLVSSSSSDELPAGIIRVLLSLSFSQYNDNDGLNLTAQCSNNILMETVQREVHSSSDPVIINIIVSVCNELGLSLQLFLDHLLTSVISRPPFYNSREMLTRQNEVTFSCIEEGKSKLLNKVAMLMGHSLCWKNIIKISQSSNVNWFGLLQFISCCLHTHIDHVTGFKKGITDLLSLSLSQENEEYLVISLLLSRQGGMEGGHVFPSYGNWFKSVFGSSHHSLIDSKRNLTFLMKCLTNLINEDPPYCLQAHITFPPRKLAKCSQLVTGYIVKAKSRLDYLQVDYDYIDTTEDNTEINHEFSLAEVELNDIMSSFEGNNCQTIPNKLLEYQIFNQPYYTGRILRLLLVPRQIPSPPDTREKLIEALKKRDKSHQSMFAKYEKECKKLNDSNNGEGSSSSKRLLMYSPLEEKLERLKRHYGDNEDQLGPILSQVSTAINKVVSDVKKSISNNDKSSKKHNGDVCSPGLKEWEIQVVQLLLKYITEIIIKISLPLNESEMDITDKQFVLVDLFVKMLSSHVELHWPLVMMIYELMHDKYLELTDSHYYSISVLCVSLYKEAIIYQDIAIRWQPCCVLEPLAIQDSTDYCLYFMRSLVHVNTEGLLKTAKFYCHFFHNLLTSGGAADDILKAVNDNDSNVINIVHKFSYISKRLAAASLIDVPPKFNEEISDVIKMIGSLNEAPLMSQIMETIKFDPNVWLPWELSFDISSDFLTPLARRKFRRVELSTVSVVKQVELVLCSVLSLQMRYCSSHLLESIRVAVNNNQFESMQLINELIGLTTPTSERPLPLLLNSFAIILENYDNEMHKIKLVQNFISLMLGLPPYLIFSDTPTTPPTDESLISLADFISDNILLYINLNFVLSLDITHHLIIGLKQSLDNTSSSRSSTELFLEKCPILLASILYHWSEVRVLSEDNIIKDKISKKMNKIYEWAKSDFSLALSSFHFFSSSYLPGVSVFIFNTLVASSNTDGIMLSFKMFLDQTQSKFDTKLLLTYIFDCCIRKLTGSWAQLLESPLIENQLTTISKFCLEKEMSVWRISASNNNSIELITNFRRQFPSNFERRIMPLVFMKILLPIKKSLIQKLALDSNLVKFIFTIHSNLLTSNDDHHLSDGSITNIISTAAALQSDTGYEELQSFCPAFYRHCTALVKTFIEFSSVPVLKNCLSWCHSSLKQSIKSKITA